MKSIIKLGPACAVVLFCSQCTNDAASHGEPAVVETARTQPKTRPEPHPETAALADCINKKNGNDTRSRQYAAPLLLAHTRSWKGKDKHIINGYLGHHVTWAINVDVSANPAVAYETFGPGAEGAFGRLATPKGIIRAVKSCGVVWNTEEVKPLVDWVAMQARYEAAVKAKQELADRYEAAARKRKNMLAKDPS